VKAPRRPKTPKITDRQREVVELIAAGYSNVEVALRLGISPRTAKAHSDALRRKLGVRRRRQIPSAYLQLTGDDPLATVPRRRRRRKPKVEEPLAGRASSPGCAG
jgi:DNA-binding CsgD family transcriptional regulator